MPDIATLKDSQVSSEYPGQTSLNFFGEGGKPNSEAGRELCDDREQWEHWYLVSRPPENKTWSAGDETEYFVQRLGDDDVVATNSRNLEVQKQVREKLSRDLVKGEAVLFTGDGTNSVYIDLRPGGHIDLVTSGGTVNLGGTAADSEIARYKELESWVNAAVVGLKDIFDNHGHQYLPGPGGLVASNGPMVALGPSAVPTPAPALPAGVASTTGKCD